MENKLLTMNRKEINRLKVLESLTKKEMIVKTAAETLGLSERQIYRIKARYINQGAYGITHRSRGKPSCEGFLCSMSENSTKITFRVRVELIYCVEDDELPVQGQLGMFVSCEKTFWNAINRIANKKI